METLGLAIAAGVGLLIILIAWLPAPLKKLPLTLPIVCVGLGVLAAPFLPSAHTSILRESRLAEYLAESTLVMALLGSGLKIDRPFSFRNWRTTWRLLGIAMPLTIAAIAVLGHQLANWPLAPALLLGAALAPTDPVLASSIAVGPPGTGEEGEIRFGLTTEAALNDGLAFPFVALSLYLSTHNSTLPPAGWLAVTFLWSSAGGVVLGAVLGRIFGWLLFTVPIGRLSDTQDGIVAVGLAVISFAGTELLGFNGFLAVFAAALAMRSSCPEASFHNRMDNFTGQLERLLGMLLLVGFGATLGSGLFSALDWRAVLLGVVLLFVVRPLTGWISLIGSPHPAISRGLTAFFGLRGIGTLYYLLYALNHGQLARSGEIAATVGFAVLCSIVVHGALSTPLMHLADEARARSRKRNSASGEPQF